MLVGSPMRSAPFLVGSLVVIGLSSSLFLITPPRIPSGSRVQQPLNEIRRDQISSVFVPEPYEYPSQHTMPCDFSRYRPNRIPDWLPRGVVQRAIPSYPADARRRGIKGTVNVLILINMQGTVERVCSTGPRALRKAAEAAAVKFRFRRPTINDGVDPLGYIQETLVFKFDPEGRE
jgi:TonB family protein